LCPGQQNKLTVAPPEQIVVKRGGSVTQRLVVQVAPGLHVNSDKPRDEFLIPLKLTWTSGPLEAKAVTYPQPEEIKVGPDMLVVFTGKFQIQTEFQAPQQITAGSTMMTGKLRYQACNNQMCFRPASVDFTVPVQIQ
jgi:hypothetical protein